MNKIMINKYHQEVKNETKRKPINKCSSSINESAVIGLQHDIEVCFIIFIVQDMNR